MQKEPDIVKELRESEKLGLFYTKIQSTYEQLETMDDIFENIPDKTIIFADENHEETGKISKEITHEINNLINTSPITFFLWKNVEGWPVEFTSDNVKNIFGYTAEEFISCDVSFIDAIHPDDLKRTISEVEKYSKEKTRKEFTQKYRIITKNGKIKWIEDKKIIRRNKQGKITHYHGILWDITNHKIAVERYKILFDSSRDALMTFAPPDWKFTSGNHATVILFKAKDEAEFTKMGPWDISPKYQPDGESSTEKAKKMIEKAMDKGSNFFEWMHKTLDGKEFPTTVLLTRVEIEKNKPFLQAIVRDITEIKKAEEEIILAKIELERKNQQHMDIMKRMNRLSHETETTLMDLNQIFNNAADGIVVINKDFRILRINQTYLEMFGIDKTRSIGKKCFEVFQFQRCQTDNCPMRKIIKNNKRDEYEETIMNNNNTDISCFVTSLPYLNSNNEVIGIVENFRDITELKKIESELREYSEQLVSMNKELVSTQDEREDYVAQLEERTAQLQKINTELSKSEKKIKQQNNKLKKLDQLKSAFLNITSHELRTPMSSIKGYVQMILKETLGEITDEQKKSLEIVLRNTNRLDNLIQDILDISRLESGTMKFITEITNINKMISDVVETMKSSAELKEITIHSEVLDNVQDLSIDQDRVKQVLINLMNNAIKFSSEGTVINVRAKTENENILFEVQDFGRGIPKNQQKMVFDTFYQVDSGVDRKFGGAGLGLAISRGIVLAHGGKIWVESKVNKGSTFKFTLPIKSVEDLEERFKDVDVFRLQAIS